MSENRLPKQVLYGQLEHGTRSHGGQQKRYKHMLKSNLKACSIAPNQLKTLAQDRALWRTLCKVSVQQFESERVTELQRKRCHIKQARDRQLAALHVTHVVASAPQELVFAHIAELIIHDPRSVVSMAQSIIIHTLLVT